MSRLPNGTWTHLWQVNACRCIWNLVSVHALEFTLQLFLYKAPPLTTPVSTNHSSAPLMVSEEGAGRSVPIPSGSAGQNEIFCGTLCETHKTSCPFDLWPERVSEAHTDINNMRSSHTQTEWRHFTHWLINKRCVNHLIVQRDTVVVNTSFIWSKWHHIHQFVLWCQTITENIKTSKERKILKHLHFKFKAQ